MRRRDFLCVSAVLGSSLSHCQFASAREPINRSGPARFQVALAAYSLRDYFSYKKGNAQTPRKGGKAIDMVGFLDYCVDNGFDAAELTSYFFKPDADDNYFRMLKHEAFVRGVAICGTAIGNNFTIGKGPKLDEEVAKAKDWIEKAAVLGAPHIRFFAGKGKELAEDPGRLDEAAAALNDCANLAASKGIFLGVENHGNLTSDQMMEIMKRAESQWVGINLDTGNFLSEDPYADIERCVPYAVNVQVKVSMKSPDGRKYDADLNRIGKILKSSGYQGSVVLEYEDKDPYTNIPRAHEELRAALA